MKNKNKQEGNLLDFLLGNKPTIETISHPIMCISCPNLILERNQQDNGCRYCCEYDEAGEFYDKCKLNEYRDSENRFDEGFNIRKEEIE